MKYSNITKDIALASMFLSITIVASLISGSYIPKIPFLDAHLDFWYGIAIVGILFLRSPLIAISYVFAIVFGMMIFELPSYAGIGDYFIETGIPVMFILLFYCIKEKTEGKVQIMIISLYLIVWTLIRLLFLSIGGNIFWGINFKVSLIINSKNVFMDLIVIALIIVPIYSLQKHFNI